MVDVGRVHDAADTSIKTKGSEPLSHCIKMMDLRSSGATRRFPGRGSTRRRESATKSATSWPRVTRRPMTRIQDAGSNRVDDEGDPKCFLAQALQTGVGEIGEREMRREKSGSEK